MLEIWLINHKLIMGEIKDMHLDLSIGKLTTEKLQLGYLTSPWQSQIASSVAKEKAMCVDRPKKLNHFKMFNSRKMTF